MSDRPNVLLILSDQHNAKFLSCTGHPDVKTPHLDRMASEGVRFDACTTANPICTPSRISYFSGQYVHNHGYFGLSGPPTSLPNLFGHFRRFGYVTSAIGKIHCPAWWVEDQTDVFHETCNCSIDGRSKKYAAFLTERGKLEKEDHLLLSEFGPEGRQRMDSRCSDLTYEESQEGWAVSESIAFMKAAAEADQPFLAHVSLPRPHQCTTPSEPFWSMYKDLDPTLPPNVEHEGPHRPPHLIHMYEAWKNPRHRMFEPKTYEAFRRRKIQGYLGAVSQVDHAVGQLLDFLRESGLAEDTVVMYAADHGEYVAEHGIMEKAPGICHDAVTRVPMLWWAPGRIAEGHEVSSVVETVDVANTACKLAGLEPMETADGADLCEELAGGSGDADRCGLTENPWLKSLRKGRYRLVSYPRDFFPEEYPDGFGELYDLAEDPWEMRNLYFEAEYAPVVNELRQDLLDKLVQTARPTTVQGVGRDESALKANKPERVPDLEPLPSWQSVERYQHRVNGDGKIHPGLIAETPMHRRNYF
jgi:choline-sulfatase